MKPKLTVEITRPTDGIGYTARCVEFDFISKYSGYCIHSTVNGLFDDLYDAEVIANTIDSYDITYNNLTE